MRKTILILYVEVMPYNLPVYNHLVSMGYDLYIVELDHKKLTPFKASSESDHIHFFKISDFRNYSIFLDFCLSKDPQLLFVSEVMHFWYWRAAFRFKSREKIPVVLGSDAQWTGSLNNRIKKISYPFTYKMCFTHALVAGLWQCVYALKIGFTRNQIRFPLYSANTNLYHSVTIDEKKGKYPKRFLYTGRFHANKGVSCLLEAWSQIKNKRGWQLTLIGHGPLRDSLTRYTDIEVLDFQPQERICEIMASSGCAVVPSAFEPWGLVIHEAVAGGLPIIVTANCGATNQFVIDNYNGYIVPENNVAALREALKKIINLPEEDLLGLSINSRELSKRITPEMVSYAIINLIDQQSFHENHSCK